MVTISYVTEEIVKRRPFLQEAISKGLINYASLAEALAPEIEQVIHKEVKTAAVMMALRRLSDKLEKTFVNNLRFDAETDVSVRSDLFEIVLYKNKKVEKKVKELYAGLEAKNRDMLSITLGIEQINIISNKRYKQKIMSKFDKSDIVQEFGNLAGITINFSMKVAKQSGFFYLLTRSLAWENISVVEIVSTLTELTIIVKEKDVTVAYDAIKKTIEEHT